MEEKINANGDREEILEYLREYSIPGYHVIVHIPPETANKRAKMALKRSPE